MLIGTLGGSPNQPAGIHESLLEEVSPELDLAAQPGVTLQKSIYLHNITFPSNKRWND